jgi:aspartate aminotransferase
VIARCDGDTSDLNVYETNRKLLYDGLRDAGFSC